MNIDKDGCPIPEGWSMEDEITLDSIIQEGEKKPAATDQSASAVTTTTPPPLGSRDPLLAVASAVTTPKPSRRHGDFAPMDKENWTNENNKRGVDNKGNNGNNDDDDMKKPKTNAPFLGQTPPLSTPVPDLSPLPLGDISNNSNPLFSSMENPKEDNNYQEEDNIPAWFPEEELLSQASTLFASYTMDDMPPEFKDLLLEFGIECAPSGSLEQPSTTTLGQVALSTARTKHKEIESVREALCDMKRPTLENLQGNHTLSATLGSVLTPGIYTEWINNSTGSHFPKFSLNKLKERNPILEPEINAKCKRQGKTC